MMHYKGSCHCGRIAFEVEGDIDGALSCNCSICRRRGSLLWFVPADRFRLLTPASAVNTYRFHQHHIQHHFCTNCGIHPYGEGTDPQGRRMTAVNLRCVDGVDLESIPKQEFDGASL
jgi:hypothetical protein